MIYYLFYDHTMIGLYKLMQREPAYSMIKTDVNYTRWGEYLPLPDDRGTEGPERGAGGVKRRSAEGGTLGRGAVAPAQYGGLGLCPQKNFRKINVEIAYFL